MISSEDQEIWQKMSCRVCGEDKPSVLYASNLAPKTDIKRLFWGHYGESGRNKFHHQINRCQGCGHVYASPYLTERALDYCYSTGDHDNTWDADVETLKKTIGRYLRPVLESTTDRECFADIGCDVGLSLEVASEKGFQNLIGIEPNQGPAESARERLRSKNAVIHTAFYEKSMIPASSVSAMSFIHVLDHVLEPQKLLEVAHYHLKSGGVVMSVTHNIDSWLSWATGEAYPAINLQHPQFFSPKSLGRMMKNAGFEVLKQRSTFNDYPLFHYVKYAPLFSERFKDRTVQWLRKAKMDRLSFTLPLGNFSIVARKC